MMNDTGSSTYYTGDTDCLSWINQLKDELANNCLFSKTADLDLTADTETIDLADELSDYVALEGLWWNGTNKKITLVDSFTRYKGLRESFDTGSVIYGGYFDGTTLYLIPCPTDNDTDAILCKYYYRPADMDGTVSYTPPWQAAFDDVAIYYCAWMAYLRERTTPNNLADYYRSLYQRARFRLFAAMRPTSRLRAYR
jgi:hypothetical protein